MVPTEATPSTESPRKGASTPLAPTVVPVGTATSPAAAQTPSASQHSETVTVAFEAAAIPAEATASPAGAAGSSPSLQSVPDSHTAAAVSSPLTSTKKILKKLCEYSGCTVQPSFNFPGERGGSNCAAHRLKGQINTVNKMCEEPGCYVRPSFKFPIPGATKQRCARHKLAGMVGNHSKILPEIADVDVAALELTSATTKRARGEVLKDQRQQLMIMVIENVLAETGGMTARESARFNPPGDVEPDCHDDASAHEQGEKQAGQRQSNKPIIIRGDSHDSDQAWKNAPQSDWSHSSAPAKKVVQPNDSVVPSFTCDNELLRHGSIKLKREVRSDDDDDKVKRDLDAHTASHNLFNPGPPFLTQRGVSMIPAATAAAAITQHVEEAAPSAQQVPIGIPGMMMRLHQAAMVHQAATAHNSLLLDPMFSMTNPYAMSPWLPNLNPWAAAAAAFTPSAFTPSIFVNAFAANQFLNPTAQSAYRFYPPFPP